MFTYVVSFKDNSETTIMADDILVEQIDDGTGLELVGNTYRQTYTLPTSLVKFIIREKENNENYHIVGMVSSEAIKCIKKAH